MEFCGTCENMLYIQQGADKIIYKCHCCGNEVNSFGSESKCISKTKFYQKGVSYTAFLNEHVFEDPTLPCIDFMICPNPKCTKPETETNKVAYIKYDPTNMLYLYVCKHCNHNWTNTRS